MTQTHLTRDATRITVGDGTYSQGDIVGNDFKTVYDEAIKNANVLGKTEIYFGPGLFLTNGTAVPKVTQGAITIRMSPATAVVAASTGPADATSDALLMHIADGANDFVWDGGQVLGHVGVASLAAEYSLIRVDANNAKLRNITIDNRFALADYVKLGVRNFNNLACIGLGPAPNVEPDNTKVLGKNNITVEGCTFYGEPSAQAGFDGRIIGIRARKVAHLEVLKNNFGQPWSNSSPVSMEIYSLRYAYLFEDCYVPSVICNKFGPDIYSKCVGRAAVREAHFDFGAGGAPGLPWAEGDHGIFDQNYLHTTTFSDCGFDFAGGGFGVIGPGNNMGQMICPTHSKPVIWIRPGTNVRKGFKISAANLTNGDEFRVQASDGGDVILRAVTANPGPNDFLIGVNTAASAAALDAAIDAKFASGLRAFARTRNNGDGTYQVEVHAVGKDGNAPGTLTLSKPTGGAAVTILNDLSQPHRPTDYKIGGTYHWASEGQFNHPIIRVEKLCGKLLMDDLSIEHVVDLDSGWTTQQKQSNYPIVCWDVTFGAAIGVSMRTFVKSAYNASGVFVDDITTFTTPPAMFFIGKTEGRVSRWWFDGNNGFGNFSQLWDSDGSIVQADVRQGHNYINGVTIAAV